MCKGADKFSATLLSLPLREIFMITAFTVRNFKAIGDDPVRIELKPIILLFGANSAGKSSILHALHYAYQIFSNRNLSPKKSTDDLNNLDLGGFESFVHNNDLSRVILIRIDFDYEFGFNDIPDSIFHYGYKNEIINSFFLNICMVNQN
jgi:AAA15 family ATPase/GTPase